MSRSAESPINSSGTTELAVNQDGSVQTGDKIRILIADDHTSVLSSGKLVEEKPVSRLRLWKN
jgi:hypothetical protein